MNTFHSMLKQRQFQRRQEEYRLTQGRLTAVEAAEMLAGEHAIPLCTAQPQKGEPVTIGMDGQPVGGHLLVVSPPSGGWFDQIICTLAQWPDAALVVDTGGRLHARTGHFRQKGIGPVYTLPGYRLDLGQYYRFWDEGQAQKLHGYLLPPYPPEVEWLAVRSVALFAAIGHFAYVYKRNLMQVLLDVASCDMRLALEGLETIPYARLYVRQFSKGQSPPEAIHDPELVQAFTLFTNQLARYQAYYSLFASEPAQEVISRNWVQARSTIFLTYDQVRLAEMGGLVTAVVAGLVRYHLSHGEHKRLLLVLDVATAGQIPHFCQLLDMVGGYGITVVLLAPSWEALGLVAGAEKREQVVSRFGQQLWYAPHDEQTAQRMSWLFGKQLSLDGVEKEPVLTPEELFSWPTDKVLVQLRRERPYRFIGQRLTLPTDIHLYQSPLLPPTATPAPRHYLDWLPARPAPPPVEKKTQMISAPTQILLPDKSREQDRQPPKQRRKTGLK